MYINVYNYCVTYLRQTESYLRREHGIRKVIILEANSEAIFLIVYDGEK